MNNFMRQRLLRGALLLALAIIFQGLRLLLPLPPVGGMFLIGSLVNMMLLLAVQYAGVVPAIIMGILLPSIAFLQGQLVLPLLVPIVAGGNVIFCLMYYYFKDKFVVWLIPLAKVLVLYIGTMLLLNWLVIPDKFATMVLFMMSWPQIITGIIGICLARNISNRLPF